MADPKKIIPEGVGWRQEKSTGKELMDPKKKSLILETKEWLAPRKKCREGVDGPKKILNLGDKLVVELVGQRIIVSVAGNLE